MKCEIDPLLWKSVVLTMGTSLIASLFTTLAMCGTFMGVITGLILVAVIGFFVYVVFSQSKIKKLTTKEYTYFAILVVTLIFSMVASFCANINEMFDWTESARFFISFFLSLGMYFALVYCWFKIPRFYNITSTENFDDLDQLLYIGAVNGIGSLTLGLIMIKTGENDSKFGSAFIRSLINVLLSILVAGGVYALVHFKTRQSKYSTVDVMELPRGDMLQEADPSQVNDVF